MSKQTRLKLAEIRLDGGAQPREAINEDVVEQYRQDIDGGAEFPPVVVFYDGTDYWLADGYHRYHATDKAGQISIYAEVHQGTQRDAVLYSVGANATHGYPRSNADKRRAVSTLLRDREWAKWSDREIAKRCAVSNHLVSEIRESVTGNSPSETTYTTKHGTIATMDTSRIGKGRNGTPKAEVVETTTEVIDRSTGEVIDDPEIVTTKTTAQHPKRAFKFNDEHPNRKYLSLDPDDVAWSVEELCVHFDSPFLSALAEALTTRAASM